jgi:hypothetical protein
MDKQHYLEHHDPRRWPIKEEGPTPAADSKKATA